MELSFRNLTCPVRSCLRHGSLQSVKLLHIGQRIWRTCKSLGCCCEFFFDSFSVSIKLFFSDSPGPVNCLLVHLADVSIYLSLSKFLHSLYMVFKQFLLPDETSLYSINEVSAVSLSCDFLPYSTFFLQQSSYDFSSLTQTRHHRRCTLIEHLLLCYVKVCSIFGIKFDDFSVPGCKFRRSLFTCCPHSGSNLLPAFSSYPSARIKGTADTAGQALAHLSAEHVHAINRELKALLQRLVQAAKPALKTLAKVFSSAV